MSTVIPKHHQFGFEWGPINVTRAAHWSPSKGREAFVIRVETSAGPLDIYASKTGRSLRVFRDGKELR